MRGDSRPIEDLLPCVVRRVRLGGSARLLVAARRCQFGRQFLVYTRTGNVACLFLRVVILSGSSVKTTLLRL